MFRHENVIALQPITLWAYGLKDPLRSRTTNPTYANVDARGICHRLLATAGPFWVAPALQNSGALRIVFIMGVDKVFRTLILLTIAAHFYLFNSRFSGYSD